MTRPSDEQLSAWLDGALSPEEAAMVGAAVAADPLLAERAASWQESDSRIAAAFAPIAQQPLDDALLARLGLAESAPNLAANDNSPWWRRHAVPLGGAIAASLVAVAVLLQTGTSRPSADQGLSLALETTPSLGSARLADGRKLRPLLTVRGSDGRYCREYQVGNQGGLACREGDGWKVEATAPARPLTDPGEIGLAGGGDAAPLAAAYARIGAGDPLDAGDEAALIKHKWKGR
jgi:hypothetical protein